MQMICPCPTRTPSQTNRVTAGQLGKLLYSFRFCLYSPPRAGRVAATGGNGIVPAHFFNEPMAAKIHIGTSGWSYKHWKQRFYPDNLKPTDYLSYYAGFFSTTEINTSFYHLPKPQTVEQWMEKVKKSFFFCPKISRYISHIKRLNDPEDTLPRFFDIFDPVQKRLGPVLIQLPPLLKFEPEKTEHFFTALHGYKGYKFALEPRHNSWFSEEAVQLLTHYKIAFVIAESGNRFPYAEYLTAKHVYVRFHGPDGSYTSSYTDAVLKSYARKFRQWQQDGHTIWAFFNNDGYAYAIHNAQRLIELTQN
jgi:uncharacterized protein YecE (DUF72 family)